MIRGLKVVSLVTLAGSTSWYLHKNDWNVSTIGLVRFGRTAVTVARISADYKISLRGIDSLEKEDADTVWSAVHTRSAEKLLDMCSKNGGVFIKVGQHIGALDYIVPPEYCNTLKVLHSNAPKSSLEDVKRVIQTDLKMSADELFTDFEDKPRGCASLAQVHKARLKETGEIVAVKVQHPRVRDHSLVDMTTMDLLVRVVHNIFPDFSFMWLAEEMKKNLPLELDFIQEAKNADRVAKLFCSKLPWLKIPKVYWDKSTHRVLTMEFVEGGEVTDTKYVAEHKLNPRTISQRLATLYSEMIFVEGYVHCDPHPGNILVHPSNDGPQIILLDHGLYTTLPEKFRLNYSQMWLAIINADVENIKKYGIELGAGDLFPLLAGILVAKPWEAIAAGLTKPKKKDNKKEKEQLRRYAAEYFPQIAQVLAKINREMLLVLKTNDLLRGIETCLGTRGEKVSLLNMSRYCVNNAYNERLKRGNIVTNVFTRISKQIVLVKLSVYQCYLWFYYRYLVLITYDQASLATTSNKCD